MLALRVGRGALLLLLLLRGLVLERLAELAQSILLAHQHGLDDKAALGHIMAKRVGNLAAVVRHRPSLVGSLEHLEGVLMGELFRKLLRLPLRLSQEALLLGAAATAGALGEKGLDSNLLRQLVVIQGRQGG